MRRRLGRDKPRYRIDIGVGDPADAIAAHAQVHGVSLVVAGRHRRRAIVDMFIGTTVGLLRQIQRPILVVSNPSHSPYRRVLMPVVFRTLRRRRYGLRQNTFPRQTSTSFTHTRDLSKSTFRPSHWCSVGKKEPSLPAPSASRPMSQLIERLGLGERRPKVTIENGDAVTLIEEELASSSTWVSWPTSQAEKATLVLHRP